MRWILVIYILVGCTREVERAPFGPIPVCNDARYVPCKTTKDHFGVDPPFTDKDQQPLCKLIGMALRLNPQTCVTWSNAEAAYYAMKSAQGAYYPQITGYVQYGAIDSRGGESSLTASSIASTTGNIVGGTGLGTAITTESMSLSWLLMDFGGREYNVEAEKEALLAANWTHNYTVQQVVFNVVQAYYQAITSDEQITSAIADLKNAMKAEESAKVQFEAGIVNIVDYLQAEANRWKYEIALTQAFGNQASAYATLAEAVGIPPETLLKLYPMPKDLSYLNLEESLHDYIARAKLERDDLQSLIAQYRQAGDRIGINRSAMFPQLSGLVDLTGAQFDSQLIKTSHTYYSAISLNWNIFNGWSDTYNLYQAKSLQKAAYANWKEQEQAVVLAVIQAFYQFDVAKENLTATVEYLKAAQSAYDATLIGYQSGINTITDLLNNLSMLADAREQEIQARSTALIASANLAFATGTIYQCP